MSVLSAFLSCFLGQLGVMVSTILWHAMGSINSETGVQWGDPLGPLLFCLVSQKVVSAISADDRCAELLFHAWYMDDGVVAGPSCAINGVLSIIQDQGPTLGLFLNTAKGEIFSPNDISPVLFCHK